MEEPMTDSSPPFSSPCSTSPQETSRSTLEDEVVVVATVHGWTGPHDGEPLDYLEKHIADLLKHDRAAQDENSRLRLIEQLWLSACDKAQSYVRKRSLAGLPGDSVFDSLIDDAERLRGERDYARGVVARTWDALDGDGAGALFVFAQGRMELLRHVEAELDAARLLIKQQDRMLSVERERAEAAERARDD